MIKNLTPEHKSIRSKINYDDSGCATYARNANYFYLSGVSVTQKAL